MLALPKPLEKESQMSPRGTRPPAPPTAPPKNLPLLLTLFLCFLTPDLLRLQILEVVDKFASAATAVIPVVTGDVVAAVDAEDEEDAGAETTGV